MSPLLVALLLTQTAAAWFMTGLIWFVQIVHYPLMDGVGQPGWTGYERRHMGLTTRVVAPAMLIEATSCGLLLAVLLAIGPETQQWVWSPIIHALLLALLATAWGSTWALQVPAHNILTRSFCPRAHRRLCASNWIRTGVWSARALLLTAMLAALILKA